MGRPRRMPSSSLPRDRNDSQLSDGDRPPIGQLNRIDGERRGKTLRASRQAFGEIVGREKKKKNKTKIKITRSMVCVFYFFCRYHRCGLALCKSSTILFFKTYIPGLYFKHRKKKSGKLKTKANNTTDDE